MPIRALAPMLVAVLAAAVGCGSDSDQLSSGSDLTGRTFHSTSVKGPDAPTFDEPLTVKFVEAHGADAVTWQAECNTNGADVTIDDGPERLDVDEEVVGTAVGCAAPQQAQDDWLTAFFTADPALSLDDDELTLSGEDGTIVLEERDQAGAGSPSPSASSSTS